MIVRQAQRMIAERLKPIAEDDAALEASFLLRANGFHSPYQSVSDADMQALEEQILQRLTGKPLPYILGEWEFYGLPICVNPSVLIPRPDTERLVEAALGYLDPGHREVLDLCCGSGCIGIALAACGGAKVTAADVSADALDLTERNARRNGVSIKTVQSDFLDSVEGVYDMIVCNPPYLSEAEMQSREIGLQFEPALALDGGPDGLRFYRRLANEYRKFLKRGGTLLTEIGMTQKEAVTALFPNASCLNDYGGRPRVVVVHEHD